MSALLWTPTEERIAATTLTRYQRWLEGRLGRSFGSYEELWRWSGRGRRGVLGVDLGLLRGRRRL